MLRSINCKVSDKKKHIVEMLSLVHNNTVVCMICIYLFNQTMCGWAFNEENMIVIQKINRVTLQDI